MLFAKSLRSSFALALEPRMMFDAAGAATLEVESTSIDYVAKTDDYDSTTYSRVLAAAEDVSVSEDGKFVYAVSSNSSTWSTDSSVLSVFSVAEDGSLTLLQTYYNYTSEFNTDTYTNDTVIQNEGLAGASLITMSSDQNYLYVFGEDDNSLVIFSRNVETGELTRLGSTELSNFGIDGVSDFVYDIQASNGYLYVAGGDQLIVLSKENDGTLSLVAQYSNDTEGVSGMTGVGSIAISEDGSTLVVGASGESSAVTVFTVNEDGTLNFVNSVSGQDDLYYIKSVQISSDGKTVYALNNDGEYSLLVMTFDEEGHLNLLNTYAVSDEATSILLSNDGTGVFVLGANIDVFLQDDTSELTLVQTISGSNNDLGVSFSSIKEAYLSADHSKLFAVVSDGVLTFSFDVPAVSYTEDESGVALLPTGLISDSELDVLDDYNGASYTVTRESGALEEDEYGFLADNSLTLEDGVILQNGSEIATFSVVDNVLTITFTTSTTQATAQQVLRQITYFNSSNDPVANGDSPSFSITVNDGDGNETTISVTVNLIGVNNPAEITTTTNEITYRTGDDYTSLFSNTSIETIESDQTIWQVKLSVTGASEDDVLKVDNGKITLEAFSGTQQTVDGISYAVSEEDGVVTVTLYLMVSSEDAADVIDNIGYKYLGDDSSGERSVSLSIVEYTSSSDIGENTTVYGSTTHISLATATEENLAPTLTSNSDQVAYTENDSGTAIFPNAVLADSQMDTYNDGLGNYHGAQLTISISEVTSSDQMLFEDNNGLSLSGTSLTKDGVVIGTVSNSDGVLTITFTEDNGVIPTTQDVQNVLNQIQYLNTSESPASTVSVSVTLSDQFGLTSNALLAQINISAVNDAPEITKDASIAAGEMSLAEVLSSAEGLENISASSVSSDGSVLYVADSNGNLAVFTLSDTTGEWEYRSTLAAVDGVNSVDKLITTSDGKSLYLLGNEGDVISVYSLSENNVLSNLQVIVSDYESNDSSVSDIKEIVLSEDGQHFYYINGTALGEMTRNSETGELSFVQTIAGAWSEPYLWQPSSITVSGNYVFVTTNFSSSTLIVFEQGDSGLSWKAYIRNGNEDSAGNSAVLSSTSHVVATDDGKYIYAVNGTSIYTYSYDTENQSFQLLTNNVVSVDNLSDVIVSADNEKLFVLTSDGNLSRYLIGENGELTLAGVMTGDSSEGNYLSISSSGYVFLQGDALTIYDATGREESLYEIGFDAVVLAPELTLFDEEMVAADDYAGLIVTLSRAEASESDLFNVLAASGYSLDGDNLLYGDQVVGTFTNVSGQLTITISASLTQDEVNRLVRNITFENNTLTQAETLTFNIQVNDQELSSASLEIRLQVAENPAPVVTGSISLDSIMEAEQVNLTLPTSLFNDTEALTIDVSGLPAGLFYDEETNTISGSATEAGRFDLVITATDSKGQIATLEVNLVVQASSTVLNQDIGNNIIIDQTGSSSDISVNTIEFFSKTASFLESSSSIVISNSSSFLAAASSNVILNSSSFLAALSSIVISNSSSFLAASSSNVISNSSAEVSINNDYDVVSSQINSYETHDAQSSISSIKDDQVNPVTSLSLFNNGETKTALISLINSVLSSEEESILAVMPADGIGLPDGIEYDSETGELSLDKTQLEDQSEIKLHLLVVDKDGNTSVVPVEVKLQSDKLTQNISALPLSEQIKQASSVGFSAANESVLAELSANQ